MTTVGQVGTDTGMSNMTSAQTEARSYPHAFFGISDKYIPTTIKEMYRWAQFIFQVNPIFSRIIHKQASYVTTELIYDCRSSQSEQLWKQMLEQVLGYKLFEKQMLLDYFTFGNAFCRFIFPKQRYLVCPKCETSYPIANIDYTFAGFRFRGTCTKCNYSGNLKAMDKPTRNRTQVKLIRIDPRYIQPIHEPITGATEYLYVVPKALASIIREGSKRKTKIRTILENVPLEVIDAVEKGHLIKFPKDTIYHLKWHSISRDDNSLGDIPFMPVFKVIWLYHTLWRAQEAVSLEHVLPWTFMSPETNSGGVEPLMNVDMSVWNSFMRETINRFRWDPNHIGLTPFPVRAINLRGDAKSLDNWQGLEHLKEVIAAGMGVPATFLFGGSTYSSASVELRVLENDFRNIVLQLNSMLEDFVIPKLVRYFSIPREKIHHEKFKMADDVQQRQLMTTMQQTGTISEKTVATELGFNHDQEKKLIEEEMLEKARLQRIIQLADAETQVAVQKIMAKGQYAVQQIMQTGKDPEEDGAPDGATGFGNQDTQLTYTTNPTALKMQAQNFIKTRSPMQQDIELQQIRATNPEYARAIEDTRKTILNPPKLTALPNEQHEGKKGPGKAAI